MKLLLLQELKEKDTKTWYRVSVSVFYFTQGLVYASWTSRIPDIKNMLALNDAQWGGVIFFIPMGEFATMALAGYLVSKYSSKLMLTIGAFVYPLALVAIGFVHSFLQLSMVLFLFGALASLCNIAVNTQAIGVERIFRRSIMGSFHGLWSLAGFFGVLFSTLIVALNISPLHHFVIICMLIFILVFYMRKSILPRDQQQKQIEENQRKIFTRPDKYILVIGLIALGSMMCEGTVYNWSSIYFESVLAIPENYIRLGYIAAMCSMTLGRFTIDRFITRFGVINVLRFGGIIIMLGLSLMVALPNIVFSTLGFLLVGAGMSPIIPICYSLAGKSKAMLPGVAIATISSISFLGLLMGPSIIGIAAESIGLRWTLGFMALFGLFIVLLTRALKKQYQPQKVKVSNSLLKIFVSKKRLR